MTLQGLGKTTQVEVGHQPPALAPAGQGNSANIHTTGKNAPNSATNTNETKSAFGTVLTKIGGAFTIGAGVVLAPIVGIIGGPILALASSKKPSNTQQKGEGLNSLIDKTREELASNSKIELAFKLGCKLAGLLPALGKQMLTETAGPKSTSKHKPQETNQLYALNMGVHIDQSLRSPSNPKSLAPLCEAFNISYNPASLPKTSAITKHIENTLNNLTKSETDKFKSSLEELTKAIFLEEDTIENNVADLKSLIEIAGKRENFKQTVRELAEEQKYYKNSPETFYRAFNIPKINCNNQEKISQHIASHVKKLNPDQQKIFTQQFRNLSQVVSNNPTKENIDRAMNDVHKTLGITQQLRAETSLTIANTAKHLELSTSIDSFYETFDVPGAYRVQGKYADHIQISLSGNFENLNLNDKDLIEIQNQSLKLLDAIKLLDEAKKKEPNTPEEIEINEAKITKAKIQKAEAKESIKSILKKAKTESAESVSTPSTTKSGPTEDRTSLGPLCKYLNITYNQNNPPSKEVIANEVKILLNMLPQSEKAEFIDNISSYLQDIKDESAKETIKLSLGITTTPEKTDPFETVRQPITDSALLKNVSTKIHDIFTKMTPNQKTAFSTAFALESMDKIDEAAILERIKGSPHLTPTDISLIINNLNATLTQVEPSKELVQDIQNILKQK